MPFFVKKPKVFSLPIDDLNFFKRYLFNPSVVDFSEESCTNGGFPITQSKPPYFGFITSQKATSKLKGFNLSISLKLLPKLLFKYLFIRFSLFKILSINLSFFRLSSSK